MSLADVQKKYEETIRDGMARALWVSAWIEWSEHPTCRHCGQAITSPSRDEWESEESGVECPFGDGYHEPPEHWAVARAGQDWDKVVPETPPAAKKAAKDLVSLIASGEGLENDPAPMATLFALAMEVDTGEPYDFIPLVKVGYPKDPGVDASVLAFRFGSDIAMESLSSGVVGWGDNHQTRRGNAVFEPALPRFECHYDGEQLTWEGSERKGEHHAAGRYAAGPRRLVVTITGPGHEPETEILDLETQGTPVEVAVHLLQEDDYVAAPAYRTGRYPFGPPMPEPSNRHWAPDTHYVRVADTSDGQRFERTYRLQNFTYDEQQQVFEQITGRIGDVIIGNNETWSRHSFVLEVPTRKILFYADNLEDALEELGDWIENNAPGLFTDESVQDEYKRLEDEKVEELGRPLTDEETYEIQEEATADMTSFDHGHYMNSHEWAIVAEDPGREELLEIGGVTYPKENPCRNPRGLTAKGERMYEHIKRGYAGDPRAKEIASRTVLARARQVPGLKKSGRRR